MKLKQVNEMLEAFDRVIPVRLSNEEIRLIVHNIRIWEQPYNAKEDPKSILRLWRGNIIGDIEYHIEIYKAAAAKEVRFTVNSSPAPPADYEPTGWDYFHKISFKELR